MSGRSLPDERVRQIAAAIDAYDETIATGNEGKKDTFASVREELEALGLERTAITAQLAAFKAAIAKRRKRAKDADAVDERDALTDDYLDVLERRPSHVHDAHAPARTREGRAAARTTEAMQDPKAMSAELAAAGLISDEAHRENIAIADGVAARFGTTDARPELTPRSQVQGLPENGRNDFPDTTVGITGIGMSVEGEPLVETSGAGEEAATSADPAPASDRPTRKDPLLDPEHVVTPTFRKLLCAQYEVEDDRFDEFRAGLIAGLSHADAAARASRVEA